MEDQKMRLKAGDWVEVRSAPDILKTLDQRGTLDGLPFMPEMLEFCGKRYKVLRRAEKTCIELPTKSYVMGEFLNNDVVILDGLRCTGSSHDGCQRLCALFWKTAWLRKRNATDSIATPADAEGSHVTLGSPKSTEGNATRYFCQSTELLRSTRPMSRPRILKTCISDLRSGSRGFTEMIRLVLAPLWRKATRRFPKETLKGELSHTPVGNLNLAPGEWVEIKSVAEIQLTLDARGKNRGLTCDFGMTQFAGKRFKVLSRLDRMVSESTGEVRNVQGTVILDGLSCLCWNVLGGCPRQDFMYWRETWLKRVNQQVLDNAASQKR
jgi:hypothetical protein